jgi:EmrB/QacA subfamily drug resistance transporter
MSEAPRSGDAPLSRERDSAPEKVVEVVDPEMVVEVVGEESVVAWPLWWRARLERRRDGGRSRDPNPWLLLATVLTGLFASGFSVTILAVSIPDIADDLGSSTSVLTFVVTGPFLALALAMPLLGKLGDVRGHRRIYLLGLTGFSIATACTALAWSAPSLITLRVVAACFGAATAPASMAMIMHAFAPGQRAKAMGWWSLVSAGAPVMGLVVGGPLVDAIGWRGIFIVQAPLAAAAVIVGFFVLPETERTTHTAIDWKGAGLLAVATISGLGALQLGGEVGWTEPLLLVPLAVAVAATIAFVLAERVAATPLIPLDLVRRRNFGASISSQALSSFAYMGGYIVTPILVQQVFDYSVGQTSFAMAVRPLTFSITAPIAGYVAVRVGERRCALAGTTLLVLSMIGFVAASLQESVALMFLSLAVGGLSQGVSVPSLVTVAANDIDATDFGVGNAAQQMTSQIGAVAGIQTLSSVSTSASTDAFAVAYTVGVIAAFGALLAATRIRRTGARPALEIVRAA